EVGSQQSAVNSQEKTAASSMSTVDCRLSTQPTRRALLRGAAAIVAGSVVSCRRAARRRKVLRIAQWSHYVPRYDQWFDKVFTKEWGEKNGTDVIVDHIAATEVPARAAAEASAGKGHALFHFLSPPAAYESHVLDLSDVVREIERRHGEMVPVARRSTFDPKTGKFFALSDSFAPDPGNYRIDLWTEAGFPSGPD